jgi:hypothetical protein
MSSELEKQFCFLLGMPRSPSKMDIQVMSYRFRKSF